MMQVPVPQHLGSFVMWSSDRFELAIGTPMICNHSVIEFHFRAS